MTADPSAAPHFRIPEPHDVIVWLRDRWAALATYAAVPRNQALWGVLAVGMLLRLGFLDLMPIRDQTSSLLSSLVEGAPLMGGVPTTMAQGGAPRLLLAGYRVLVLFSRDPRWLVAVQAAVEMTALGLLFRLVRRRLGFAPAILTLAALAINPWCVQVIRTLSAEAWFVTLGVLLLAGLDLAIEQRRLQGWLLLSVVLPVLIYLRPGHITLLLVVGACALLYRRRIRWAHLGLSALLGLIYLMPGIWVSNLTRFDAVLAWAKAWAQSLIDPDAFVATIRGMRDLMAGIGMEALAVPEAISWKPVKFLTSLNDMLGVLTIVALPVAIWIALRAWGRWREADEDTLLTVTCVWLIVGLATAWRGDVDGPMSPGLLTMMPVAGIALSVTLDHLLALPNSKRLRGNWWAQPLRLALVILIGAAGAWQAYQTLHLNGHVGQSDVSEGYGVPYRYWRRTANLLMRESETQGLSRVWLLAGADAGLLDRAPEMMSYLLGDKVALVACGSDESEGVMLPAAQSCLYLTVGASPLAERTIAQLGAEDLGVVVYPDGLSRARVQYLAERPVEDFLATIEHRGLWTFDCGARFLGADWPGAVVPGQTLYVANYWTFGDVPVEDRIKDHVAFCRLLDPSGNVVVEGEGLALAEENWDLGLMLKQWWRIDLPAGDLPPELVMQVGLYRPEDGYRNVVVDAQGYFESEAVLIGPLAPGY